MIFEWDPAKAVRNIAKHQVSFEEASTVFGDPLAITIEDPIGYEDERYITLGLSREGLILVVVHSDRDDRIRIVSARTATKNETRTYQTGE